MANINVLIPPGATSDYTAALENHHNVSNRLSNPNTIDMRIAEKRVQDKMRKDLRAEFGRIDLNNDGVITRDELHHYFINTKVSTRQMQIPLLPSQSSGQVG